MSSRPTVFIDLDSALVEIRPSGRPRADLVMRPNALEGLHRLGGEASVVVLVDPAGKDRLLPHQRDERERFLLRRTGATARRANLVRCPHRVGENCRCRKPQLGLVERAREELDLDLDGAWIVGGDAEVAAGHGAGLYSVRIGPPADGSSGPLPTPDYEARDLLDAANWILLRRALEAAS